jgi:hypothetical protein
MVKKIPANEQFAPRQDVRMIVFESIDYVFNRRGHFSTFCDRQLGAEGSETLRGYTLTYRPEFAFHLLLP